MRRFEEEKRKRTAANKTAGHNDLCIKCKLASVGILAFWSPPIKSNFVLTDTSKRETSHSTTLTVEFDLKKQTKQKLYNMIISDIQHCQPWTILRNTVTPASTASLFDSVTFHSCVHPQPLTESTALSAPCQINNHLSVIN